MIHKKIALFLLLLFSTQKLYPVEITIKLTYETFITTFITTITWGGIITVSALLIVILPAIKNFFLKKISKAVLIERYTFLGRLLIMLGQTSIIIQEANSMVRHYEWEGGKKKELSNEKFLLQQQESKEKICNLLNFLLDIKMNPNCVYSYDDYSILKHACLYKDIELAKESLAAGADPNHKKLQYIQKNICSGDTHSMKCYEYYLNYDGSPLITAFLKRDINMIQLLINHNAEPFRYRAFEKNPFAVLDPEILIKKAYYNLFNNLLDWHIINEIKRKEPTISPEYYTPINNFDECIQKFIETYPDYMIKNSERYEYKNKEEIKESLIDTETRLTNLITSNYKKILDARKEGEFLLRLT